MSDIKPHDIEALLETFEASSWSELKLKIEGLELFVSKTPGTRAVLGATESAASVALASPAPAAQGSGGHRPAASAPPASAVDGTPAAAMAEGLIAVRAPNLGTFYRAPKPGAPPYVEVGQRVEAATELCLIEVMKLFTSVHAGVAGVVRGVLVKDGELVEFDQPLFLIEADEP
jgi:acetyl-CoA carboxylase biotin carboxyl carrier protein